MSRVDSGAPLNEDIPADKKVRKSKKRNANRTSIRYNQILEGLAPSIQLYSPSPTN